MTPILPFTLWRFTDYGLVLVIDSNVGAKNDIWEIRFIDCHKDVHALEMHFMEWLDNAEFQGDTPVYNI